MSGLTLRLAAAPALRVDLRRLTPSALAGLAPDAVAHMQMAWKRLRMPFVWLAVRRRVRSLLTRRSAA